MPRRTLQDEYFKRAKREGYVARSAYKLLEINEKRRIIRRGDRVLDLGCAPGSWLQVASELVGPKGQVVGIDLLPARIDAGGDVRVMQGDFTQVDASALRGGGRPFDVVVSDMAPNTTGAGDHFRSAALCERILDRLPELLRPGGNLAMKVLEGETYPDLLGRAGSMFARCKGLKPRASRDISSEIYIVAEGYRGPEASDG